MSAHQISDQELNSFVKLLKKNRKRGHGTRLEQLYCMDEETPATSSGGMQRDFAPFESQKRQKLQPQEKLELGAFPEQEAVAKCPEQIGAEVDMLCDMEQAQSWETPGAPTDMEMDTEMGPSKAELIAIQKEKVRQLVLQYKQQLKACSNGFSVLDCCGP